MSSKFAANVFVFCFVLSQPLITSAIFYGYFTGGAQKVDGKAWASYSTTGQTLEADASGEVFVTLDEEEGRIFFLKMTAFDHGTLQLVDTTTVGQNCFPGGGWPVSNAITFEAEALNGYEVTAAFTSYRMSDAGDFRWHESGGFYFECFPEMN